MLFRRVLAAQLQRPKSSLLSANTALHFEEIPSPKGLPIIGTTLAVIAAGSAPKIHKYIDKRHKELGPIFKERLGPVSCLFVADPDEVRVVFEQEGKFPMHITPEPWLVYNKLYGCPRGLLFMDGPDWWYYRRILNRQLLKGDLRWIEDACECVSDNLIKQLQISDNCYRNLQGTLYKWSLDTMVAMLLGAETYKQNSNDLDEQITNLARIVHSVFETTAKLSLISAPLACKFKIPRWNRFVHSADNVLENANSLVTKLLKIVNPKSDALLSKLLKDNIPHEDLQRIIVDLVLAAGDTTVYSMEWMLYLIAKNKQTQENLRTNPDLAKNVLRETLRLYPVAPFITRILPEDSILGGYGVPKNTLVVMSMYTTGRDERYFKNPNSFKPERWDRRDDNYNIDMQKASLPFAMGLRACVGRKLAERQLQTTLLSIVNNFHVEIHNDGDVQEILRMVVVPSEPLKLQFKKLL